jgi:hypothetical protein
VLELKKPMEKNVLLKGYRKLRPNEILRKGDIFLDHGGKITETMISGNPVNMIPIFYYRKIAPKPRAKKEKGKFIYIIYRKHTTESYLSKIKALEYLKCCRRNWPIQKITLKKYKLVEVVN